MRLGLVRGPGTDSLHGADDTRGRLASVVQFGARVLEVRQAELRERVDCGGSSGLYCTRLGVLGVDTRCVERRVFWRWLTLDAVDPVRNL